MIDCGKRYGCKYWDANVKDCNCIEGYGNGKCQMEDEMEEAMMYQYGLEFKDPLDKPATEITPFDVYSPSELGISFKK